MVQNLKSHPVFVFLLTFLDWTADYADKLIGIALKHKQYEHSISNIEK